MSAEALPATTLPLAVRSPGKCILFGEHAVVHERAELVLAIDLYTQVGVSARSAAPTRLNGDPGAHETNPYFRAALARLWPEGAAVDVTAVSRIPRAAGLGSSAAFVASVTGAFGAATGGIRRVDLARRAFEIEHAAQGVGSPGDTSASIAGGLISLNGDAGDPLWDVQDGERRWIVRRVRDPGWVWLVGYTGIPRATAEAVRAFGARVAEPDGPELLAAFDRVAQEGIAAVLAEDPGRVGALLFENHRLLASAGVSHPRLEALVEAVRPLAYGAKLTGAGRGGSVIALLPPGKEMEAARRVAHAGGVPYVVRSATAGTELVSAPPTAGVPAP